MTDKSQSPRRAADPLPRPGIIVFDVDGTLVDVARSYRGTLPVAAGRYLRLLGFRPPALSVEAYDLFKRMGSFNDDWDLTAGLLESLVAGLPPAPPLPERSFEGIDDLLAALRESARSLAGLVPPLPDLAAWIEPVRRRGGGLAGLRQVIANHFPGSVGHNAHLVWHTGSAATTDLVQRVFEEIYLGADLFARAYGMPSRFHQGSGMMAHESLLISLGTLEALSSFARLGIATGRADFELAPTLDLMRLGGFFPARATMTDALAARPAPGESLLKPHPYLLHQVADALDPDGTLVAAYVGDTADDVVAARRADRGRRRWLSIALTTAAGKVALRSEFMALGADLVLSHPDELAQLWT